MSAIVLLAAAFAPAPVGPPGVAAGGIAALLVRLAILSRRARGPRP